MIANVKQTWDQWLGFLVKELPSLDEVLKNLRLGVSGFLDEKTHTQVRMLGDPAF